MLCPPYEPPPLVVDWLERHTGRLCVALHVVGIPPTIFALLILPIAVAALSPSILLLSVGTFVGGYLLQFLGHWLEGTDPGELTYLKGRLARRFAPSPASRPSGRGVAV